MADLEMDAEYFDVEEITCPNCGSEVEVVNEYADENVYIYNICCTGCEAHTDAVYVFNNKLLWHLPDEEE